MARPHIAISVRRVVIQRASSRCEYCLLPTEWASISHHVDHIIPLRHGGTTAEENLAYACNESSRLGRRKLLIAANVYSLP